jgi:hypothetical protein
MEYLFILFAVAAAVAASVMIVNILPFSIDKKLNPWLMFGCALLMLNLPHMIVLALAMTIPMGLIYGWTGIRLQGHEPVRLPVEQVKGLANHIKIPKRQKVSQFLTREYPDPGGHVEKFVPDL